MRHERTGRPTDESGRFVEKNAAAPAGATGAKRQEEKKAQDDKEEDDDDDDDDDEVEDEEEADDEEHAAAAAAASGVDFNLPDYDVPVHEQLPAAAALVAQTALAAHRRTLLTQARTALQDALATHTTAVSAVTRAPVTVGGSVRPSSGAHHAPAVTAAMLTVDAAAAAALVAQTALAAHRRTLLTQARTALQDALATHTTAVSAVTRAPVTGGGSVRPSSGAHHAPAVTTAMLTVDAAAAAALVAQTALAANTPPPNLSLLSFRRRGRLGSRPLIPIPGTCAKFQ